MAGDGDVEFCVPAFLIDPNDEASKHEKLLSDAEKKVKKILDSHYTHYKENLAKHNWDKQYSDAVSTSRKLTQELNFLETKYDRCKSKVDNVRRELNVVKLEVPEKQDELLRCAQELDQLKDKEQQLKQKAAQKKDDMLKQFNALVCAKDVYKKNLNCHVRVSRTPTDQTETDTVIITLGSTVSSEENQDCLGTVQLAHKDFQSWKLLGVNPRVEKFEEHVKNLEENGDVRGLLCCLHQEFKRMNKETKC